MKTKIILVILIILAIHSAFAAPPPAVQLGLPSPSGSGCPAGTVAAVLSPDKSVLSVLFDQFTVEAGPSVGRNVDSKKCSLKIPLRIVNGPYSLMIIAADYRGAAVLPPNSNLFMTLIDTLITNGRGGLSFKTNRQMLNGPYDQNFLYSTNSPSNVPGRPTLPMWTACSQNYELNTSAQLDLKNNNPAQDALATMDSTDIAAQVSVTYKIAYKACFR